MRKIIITTLLLFTYFSYTTSQETSPKPIIYLEPEIHIGKLIPHAPGFPKSPLNTGVHLSIGKWNPSATEGWEAFYKHPQYGLDVGVHWFGNKEVVGQQFTVMPFVTIPTSRTFGRGVEFKLSMGINAFTNWYDATDNPDNNFIGSPLTWAFHVFIQKTWSINEHLNIKGGIGLIHASNGHTTLPNFGLNSMTAAIALQYFKNKKPEIAQNYISYKNAERHYYLIARQSYGTHELGGAISPKGGKNYGIHQTSIAAGFLFKKHILLRTGFSYRQYRSYLNYINENNLAEYIDRPALNASNFMVFVGSEFLMGHFSIDIELGINVYKPFYKTHWSTFEKTSEFDRWSKQFIATRMGVNAYLFNTKNLPKHNVSVGAFIDANMGQADFTEFSLMYTHRLK